MEINLKKEQTRQRIERALRNNLKKRKVFQKKINKKIVKIFPMVYHPMVMMLEFQMSSKFLQM